MPGPHGWHGRWTAPLLAPSTSRGILHTMRATSGLDPLKLQAPRPGVASRSGEVFQAQGRSVWWPGARRREE